ncbi:MAG: septum formation initiator family protein [Deltaproteobacteria bacterium]|jgi:cell division protein FtsB|nr:MAG: septum formation initiator family protein [Deltaproteobacteria bacterium]
MRFRTIVPQRWPIYLFGSLIVMLSLVTVVGKHGALHLWQLRGEKDRLDEQNFRMQKENAILRDRVYRIRNDNAFLEKVAREELNLVRPGEVIYRFPSQGKRGAPRQGINDPASEARPSAAQKEPRQNPR